jgi:hypothetical protein
VAAGSLGAPALIAVFGVRGPMAVSGAALVLLVMGALGPGAPGQRRLATNPASGSPVALAAPVNGGWLLAVRASRLAVTACVITLALVQIDSVAPTGVLPNWPAICAMSPR